MTNIFNVPFIVEDIVDRILELSSGKYKLFSSGENEEYNPLLVEVKIDNEKNSLKMKIESKILLDDFMETPVSFIKFELRKLFLKFDDIFIKSFDDKKLVKFYSNNFNDNGKFIIDLTHFGYDFSSLFEVMERYESLSQFPIEAVLLKSDSKEVQYEVIYKNNFNNHLKLNRLYYKDSNFKIDFNDSIEIDYIGKKVITKDSSLFTMEIYELLETAEMLADINIDDNALRNKFEYTFCNVYPEIISKQLPADTSEWTIDDCFVAMAICDERGSDIYNKKFLNKIQ